MLIESIFQSYIASHLAEHREKWLKTNKREMDKAREYFENYGSVVIKNCGDGKIKALKTYGKTRHKTNNKEGEAKRFVNLIPDLS